MGVSGMSAVAQQFAAVSFSSSQVQGSTGGQVRSGPPREDRLRISSSLQDFSSPYWNGGSPSGVPRSASSVAGFGASFSVQQIPRNEGQGVPTLTTIKSNIGRRPSLFANSTFGCNAIWTKGGAVLVSLTFGLALFYLGLVWAGFHLSNGDLEYAIVMDCGSTGTRVHVYAWTHEMMLGKDSLPVMVHPTSVHPGPEKSDGAPSSDRGKKQGGRAYKRMETEPGLDKLLHNQSGVRAAIQPLIDWAAKQIPRSSHKKTKLFFLATAGLRKLPPSESGWLLDKAWSTLKESPFLVTRQWVRIISGQEEAYYGWIALNHNHDRLGRSPRDTFGALDLGGSSLEVTFEPDKIPRAEYGVNVSVGSGEHHLYAYSHPGFGLNDAFEKSVALLIQRGAYTRRKGIIYVQHPCLNPGYKEPFVCSHCALPPSPNASDPHKGRRNLLAGADLGRSKVLLAGKSNWSACQSLALSVINLSLLPQTTGDRECEYPPCALGRHQPEPQGKFYALAGFFVVYKFFGLTSTNSLNDLLIKGQQFCKLRWHDARQSVAAQPSIDRYCFRAPYVVSLLLEGLHLSEDQILIGSGDFAWTLGAALNEAGALLPETLRREKGRSGFAIFGQSAFTLDVQSVTFLVVVSFLLILLLVTCYRRWMNPSRAWRRQYLPLFVTSSGGVSSPSGDGRVKQPHSPAPSGPNKDFHHQMFGSGSMAGGDGPVSACDVLPLFSVSGTFNPKGGKLSSRRTASREDLSAYTLVDSQHMPKVSMPREVSPVRYPPIRHGTI